MAYRNKFEKTTGDWLTSRKTSFSYESERLPYTVRGTYIPDFIISNASGKVLYIETKGNGKSFDGVSRRKLLAVKEQHPDKDIRIVFYSDGKIGPKRKDGTCMRQSDWANKHGFQYAIKTIPEEWLDE